MAKQEKPFHLIVRFADSLFDVGDVVALHNEVVEKKGSVWFGKMGQTISQIRIDKLTQQIAENIPTYLYLVKGNRKKSTAYQAPLLSISRELPTDQALIPPYYTEKDILQFMKVFMKIGKITKIEMKDLNKLQAVSSVYPMSDTLARSSSGYFLVHEKKIKE
ncbi:hypothetical protein JR338_06200 [Chloroflexota bacterium]|nr:hypothetical protein JR338_06200 [Chloroflexota bacterium]